MTGVGSRVCRGTVAGAAAAAILVSGSNREIH